MITLGLIVTGRFVYGKACGAGRLLGSALQSSVSYKPCRVLTAEHRFIVIRTLDLRFRQGIQALETHLLLPEDVLDSAAELEVLPKSARLSLG